MGKGRPLGNPHSTSRIRRALKQQIAIPGSAFDLQIDIILTEGAMAQRISQEADKVGS